MSCAIYIRCPDCERQHHDIGNADSGVKRARWAIEHAALLETLHAINCDQDPEGIEVTAAWWDTTRVDLTFFHDHRGHKLVIADEYGRVYT